MKPIVHIVHHVDTEGPLYESLEETFARLNDILGEKLNIEPTRENLLKLQNGLYEGLNTEKKRIDSDCCTASSVTIQNFME